MWTSTMIQRVRLTFLRSWNISSRSERNRVVVLNVFDSVQPHDDNQRGPSCPMTHVFKFNSILFLLRLQRIVVGGFCSILRVFGAIFSCFQLLSFGPVSVWTPDRTRSTGSMSRQGTVRTSPQESETDDMSETSRENQKAQHDSKEAQDTSHYVSFSPFGSS